MVQEILATLEDYADAYCAKDITAMMALFDDSNDIAVIGTGRNELCIGQDEVRALFLNNFAQAQANKFEWGWHHIIFNEDHSTPYATVAIALIIHLELDGQLMQVPIRWTVSMKKTDRWRWLHRHASSPADCQADEQAYPVKD